ncbi:OsmC family protein [Undibacterium sp. TJN19]|uniref:OsmC family protein n=1 Tax=Undibacterium sp. TJN19 TaxID=3413055 RepID=UPI003BF39062
MIRTASAAWTGGLKNGKGHISSESGVMKQAPYGFASRFESGAGTNPEELIAAAHAGCYTMALACKLDEAGMTADHLETTAAVMLERLEEGFVISAIHLTVRARIANADKPAFAALAAEAKTNCPVSRLVTANVTLDAQVLT